MKAKRLVGLGKVTIVVLVLLMTASLSFGGDSRSAIRTIVPELWLEVESPNSGVMLESPNFDREGNLYVTDAWEGKIYKISSDKKIKVIYNSHGKLPCSSLDVHKDGRLFVTTLTGGKIIAMNPDGTGITDIVTNYNGYPLYAPDDLVFASDGSFYFTDIGPTSAEPAGKVYHVSSDFKTVTLLVDHVDGPNGISLKPGERGLWVGCYKENSVIEINLMKDRKSLVHLFEVLHIHYFNGCYGPDSNYIDSEGNLYQALYKQGKFAILNNGGILVAEILIPGRDEGKFIFSTATTMKPGTNETFCVASGPKGKGGACIWKYRGLAKAMTPFSHQ